MTRDKRIVENVVQPGKTYRVDADKFAAMETAVLTVMPEGLPGVTVTELKTRALPHLPETLFPGGAKAGWWINQSSSTLKPKASLRAAKPARCGCTGRNVKLRRKAMSFQGYLNTIREKTGKDVAALRAWADGEGLSENGKIKPDVKAGAVVAAAKEDLGLGHGHAMAVVALLKGIKKEGDS